jgi:cation:H+ antiporter
VVSGARAIARSFGVSEFVIGATVVAIGTSMPELATTVVAKLRGQSDFRLGTILGSNIFNGFLIVGLAAVIHPIQVTPVDVVVALACGLLGLLLA